MITRTELAKFLFEQRLKATLAQIGLTENATPNITWATVDQAAWLEEADALLTFLNRRTPQVWISASKIVSPSDETKIGLAEDILYLLKMSKDREGREKGDPLFDVTVRLVAS